MDWRNRNGSTAVVHKPEETRYNVCFMSESGNPIESLRESGVPFSRVIDVMKLYRNQLAGETPTLAQLVGCELHVSYVIVEGFTLA